MVDMILKVYVAGEEVVEDRLEGGTMEVKVMLQV
jgi:hypothetical protein